LQDFAPQLKLTVLLQYLAKFKKLDYRLNYYSYHEN